MCAAPSYPPHVLRDYALIADGERGALVGPRGDIVWLCAPRWDSDAVFSDLIGGDGVYGVTPVDDRFVWGGYYEPGTLIWRSRWITTDGIIECREALAFPGEPDRAVILRRITPIDTPANVRVVLRPRDGFGRKSLREVHGGSGVWTALTGELRLRWSGAEGARHSDGTLTTQIAVEPGSYHDLVLEISRTSLPDDAPDADKVWEATTHTWSHEVPELGAAIAPRDARHAYAVLRGMTSASGAMVAAATTSLPERAQAGRNYDYRYAWVRDQAYVGQAAAVRQPLPLLDCAVSFLSERLLSDGPKLRPVYTVGGEAVPDEQTLSSLPGYPGGGDKIGNRAGKQFQLDAFGEALLVFAAAARHDHLDTDHWRAAEAAAAAIESRWQEPDAGLWELDDEQWTHSRLTCVAGLRAISAHAPATQAGPWEALADTILAATAKECLHPTGRWQRSPTDAKIDAALVFPVVRGALAADDPRSLATLRAVLDELESDHFVYRFRQEPGPLSRAEGAFILCGFMLALAQHQQGDQVSAARFFERNRAACGTPGLFSEEFDVDQRQLRGNLPQAFVHALMLEAADRLPMR
jgi:GH15 family glucan-1,4-alpha-glucosidase